MTWSLLRSISPGVVTALLLTACATAPITSVWKDPSYQRQPLRILVIGVAKKPVNKRVFEDEFVRQLKARGTDAVAGYTVMPDTQQRDQVAIAAKMKEQGTDALLITRLVSKKTVQAHVSGSFSVVPSYYGNWRDYYAYGSQVTYTHGYTAEEEHALMETNLYDAGDDKLVWHAISETEIFGSDVDQIKLYIGTMVNAMAKQKLLR